MNTRTRVALKELANILDIYEAYIEANIDGHSILTVSDILKVSRETVEVW